MSGRRPPGVELRPWRTTDREFLVALYATTRAEELEASGWPPAQRDAFARLQFDLQEKHYARELPLADRDQRPVGGRRAGRLIIDRRGDEIRLVDISILPEHRGRGVGSALIGELLAEARATGRPTRLHVVWSNPARRLYARLGFVQVGATGAHLALEWRPKPAAPRF